MAINGGRLAISTDVAKGGVFNQGGHDSYVGINMGKHGSGAPMKQADGSIKTRTAHIMSKYQHHTQGAPPNWVISQAMSLSHPAPLESNWRKDPLLLQSPDCNFVAEAPTPRNTT